MMASQGDKDVPENLNYNIGESIIHPSVTWIASTPTEPLPSGSRAIVPIAEGPPHLLEGHRGLQIPLESMSGRNKKTVNVNYVTGNTGVKFFQAHNEDSKESSLKNILDQSQLRLLTDFDQRTFLKTEISVKCQKIVQSRGFVTIISPQGQGKTITSLHLLKSLENESRKPFILTDPYQWDLIPVHQHTGHQDKYAVLIDDVFGRSHYNPDFLKCFEQRLPMILPLIEAGIVSLIITSRTNIFLMCTYNHPSSVVELSVSLYDMMYTAAERGHTEVIKCFFKRVVDLSVITGLSRSLLYCAVENGHTELVKYLDGKIRKEGNTQFEAGHQEYMEMVKFLFGRNTDLEEELVEIVRFLVLKEAQHEENGPKNPPQPHLDGETLHAKMSKYLFGKDTHLEKGRLEIVNFFVKKGTHHYTRDTLLNNLLNMATKKRHKEIIKYLIEKGANPEVRHISENSWDIWGYSPLQLATQQGHSDIVKCLIEKGADMEVRDMWRYSPLHMATEKGHAETVRILIENDANINVRNIWRYSPLHIAIEKGQGEIARMLIVKGADLNVRSWSVYSPLQMATERGQTEIANCLIENGADLSVTDWMRNTPLHMATEKGHKEIVKYLIRKGSDLEVRNYYHRSPLNIAAQQGHLDLVKYLINAGAALKATRSLTGNDGKVKEVETDNHLQTRQLYLAAEEGNVEMARRLGGKGMKQHGGCILS